MKKTINQNYNQVVDVQSLLEDILNEVRNSVLVNKTKAIIIAIGVLYSIAYALLLCAFIANCVAVISGGTAALSAANQLEAVKDGAIFTPISFPLFFHFLKTTMGDN